VKQHHSLPYTKRYTKYVVKCLCAHIPQTLPRFHIEAEESTEKEMFLHLEVQMSVVVDSCHRPLQRPVPHGDAGASKNAQRM